VHDATIRNPSGPACGTKNSLLAVSFLSALLYLAISFAGLVHIYAYNELIDDHGCSVGSLFCHGTAKSVSAPVPDRPAGFSDRLPVAGIPILRVSFFAIYPKRGPPLNPPLFIL
jgi:hypothetical protein